MLDRDSPPSNQREAAMEDLRQCQDGHRQLLSISSRLASVIARDTPPPANLLFNLRQEFASVLIRHLKAEDWLVYPKLLRSSDPSIVHIAQFFVSEMGGLALAFREHSERWGAYAINSDWASYRQETAQLLKTLKTRITREDRDLYPLCSVSVMPAKSPQRRLTS
jgi:hypothetical protein